ncbi:MAG TPA: helix-turn-helix transcriptional regulator [Dehalococcoidales bacterium]|nr:helix-turn-helix transcriptional regulator [Dehalococcoidales bacterium]
MDGNNASIGKILKRQRMNIPLTLQELSRKTGISPSHIGRIERGQRFPSAKVLIKLAKPLGYDENELFTLAGYLNRAGMDDGIGGNMCARVDPLVLRMLSQEPLEVQRNVVNILNILKSLSKTRIDLQNQNPGGYNL